MMSPKVCQTDFFNSHFKDLRVGLFVGGGHGEADGLLTAKSVITDRDTMRETPDILLANARYDYLLIRPI